MYITTTSGCWNAYIHLLFVLYHCFLHHIKNNKPMYKYLVKSNGSGVPGEGIIKTVFALSVHVGASGKLHFSPLKCMFMFLVFFSLRASKSQKQYLNNVYSIT